jgi:hypothetical protein
MSPIHQSRSRVFGIATMFAFTLLAPVAVSAQEEVADTTQQEVPVLAPVTAPSVVSTSGEDGRAIAAERALLSGDIGSMQEDALLAVVSAAPSWDETSGYGAVEASRAVIGHPVTSTTEQVSPEVRWAPAGTIGPESSIEASYAVGPDYLPGALERGTRAESPLLWTILHQDDAVSVNPSDDRIAAALLAEFRAIELSLSRYLGAD